MIILNDKLGRFGKMGRFFYLNLRLKLRQLSF